MSESVPPIDDIPRQLGQVLYNRPHQRQHGVGPFRSEILAIRFGFVSHTIMLWLLIRPAVNWFDNNLRFRDSRWVQRSATPSDIQRHTRKIDNTSVPTVATQIMRGAHKDTVHRARFDAQ